MLPKFECDCCKGRKPEERWTATWPRHATEVESHLLEFAGKIDQVMYSRSPGGGPVNLYIAGPTEDRPFCVLLTAGLSNLPMALPAGIEEDCRWAELSICLPPDWRFTKRAQRKAWWWWPVRELLQWARYPHRSCRWMWYHHTVGSMKPLAPNLPFTNMLLHPSLLLPEGFREISVSPERRIRVLSLIPLHEEEYLVCVRFGAHALIDLLEEGGATDLFDPGRGSVLA